MAVIGILINMPTPLSKVKNFVLYFPQRWNAEAFIGIICGIAGTNVATDRQRNMANELVKLMKYELGVD